jgi:hypothetical protein
VVRQASRARAQWHSVSGSAYIELVGGLNGVWESSRLGPDLHVPGGGSTNEVGWAIPYPPSSGYPERVVDESSDNFGRGYGDYRNCEGEAPGPVLEVGYLPAEGQ